MTNDDIRAATETPEHFLAMIEALSADQNYRGLDFQAKLEDLPAKDLKRLQTTIRKYTSESALHKGLHALFGKNKDIAISGLRFPELMVQIYRIVHRPTGFWRNLYRTQNLSETFNKIDDAFIQERIEMALFNESMEETFGVILKDPSLKKRFTAFLSENAAWVDTAIFTALWGATVGSKLYLGMEIDPTSWDSFIELLPPYLPGLGQCLNSKYLAIKWPSHAKKA